jgi:glycosyltransferase involved in cell wall biosynthesis
MTIKKTSIPRISVLVLTYNQQDLITRALDSILIQKEYVYEIIICDDCSTDNNWEVINTYAVKYPQIIKPIRNNYNLGIFENNEKKWEYPNGDLVYELSGDDEVGEGWFKKVISYIDENSIDYKNQLFCIYGDSKCIYPNSDSFIIRNNFIKKAINPLKLYERGMINNRSSCYSVKITKKYQKVSQGRSYISENAQDAQLHLFTESVYYIPYVGNIYYTNIGVSLNMNEKRLKEHEQTMVYAFDFFKKIGLKIDKYDRNLPQYNISVKTMIKQKTIKSILTVINAYCNSFDPNIGFNDIKFRKLFFLILRRIPHKTPFNF